MGPLMTLTVTQVVPRSGGPVKCPRGPCSECRGAREDNHHFGDPYLGFSANKWDHDAARAGISAWWECKHCSAWIECTGDEDDDWGGPDPNFAIAADVKSEGSEAAPFCDVCPGQGAHKFSCPNRGARQIVLPAREGEGGGFEVGAPDGVRLHPVDVLALQGKGG